MRRFPGFDKLYELDDPREGQPYKGDFAYHDEGFKLSRNEEAVDGPVRVAWAKGRGTPGDVIWTTSIYPLVVSARVVEILESNRLTGWATYPVEVFDKRGRLCPGYVGLVIVGRCGRIDLSRSVIALKRYSSGAFPQFVGHFFDVESWDGSDLCTEVRDHQGNAASTIIATEELVTLFERHRISNIRHRPLTEVSLPTHVYEVGLEYLLPEDFKARVTAAYEAAGVEAPEMYRWPDA